ncbi:hypothetical protein [Nostoc sp.]
MKIERWNALTPEQQEKFAPICLKFTADYVALSIRHLQKLKMRYPEPL